MKKIALITTHNANNYGAILQTFALQFKLQNYGNVTVINYQNRHISISLDYIRMKLSFHGFLGVAKDFLRLFPRIRLIKKYKKFSLTHLNLSPSFLFVVFELSSPSWGLILCFLVTLIIYRGYNSNLFGASRSIILLKYILILIFVHASLFSMFTFNLKIFLTIIGFIILYLGATKFANYLSIIPSKLINKAIIYTCYLIIITLATSIFYHVDILNYDKYVTNVFPFAEPSNFAISVSGILIAGAFLVSPLLLLIFIFVVILAGLLLPSFMFMIIGVLLSAIWMLRSSKFTLFLFSISSLWLITYQGNLISNFHIDYFLERIDFSIENSNVSALVVLQGWNRTWIALKESYGLGVGLQNLVNVDIGIYGYRIESLTTGGIRKNLADGGFVAAKIISEFGLLGIAFVFVYIRAAFQALKKLLKLLLLMRKNSLLTYRNIHNLPLYVLVNSFIISFSLDLFIRGYSYFSSATAFFIIGIFLSDIKLKNNQMWKY